MHTSQRSSFCYLPSQLRPGEHHPPHTPTPHGRAEIATRTGTPEFRVNPGSRILGPWIFRSRQLCLQSRLRVIPFIFEPRLLRSGSCVGWESRYNTIEFQRFGSRQVLTVFNSLSRPLRSRDRALCCLSSTSLPLLALRRLHGQKQATLGRGTAWTTGAAAWAHALRETGKEVCSKDQGVVEFQVPNVSKRNLSKHLVCTSAGRCTRR